MIKINIIVFILVFKITLFSYCNDINIIGNAYFNDGLGRLPISLIYAIQNDLKVNFISTKNEINLANTPEFVRKALINEDKSIGKVSILYDAPWHINGSPYRQVPTHSIKFAYSMLEASKIPKKWTNIFNKFFDGIIVPDKFLVDIYKNSGVKIPIFVLPCILLLDDFLKMPLKKNKGSPFRFGISAAFGIEKGHDIVIDAFTNEFGNDSNFELIVHGRWGNPKVFNFLKEKIKKNKLKNVKLLEKIFSYDEYIQFFNSLDCYVLLSRGEGFSITPRESLALGIPCILTDHTAHKTICESGYSIPVKANIKKPIYYYSFNSNCGYQLACNIKDAQIAMREVYKNYDKYLEKSENAREWVKQYLPKSLKRKYINLFRPKKIIYGNSNLVTDEYIMTNSRNLIKKYKIKFKVSK